MCRLLSAHFLYDAKEDNLFTGFNAGFGGTVARHLPADTDG